MDEWQENVDPASGATYYVNRKTKESTWEKPSPAAPPEPPAPPAGWDEAEDLSTPTESGSRRSRTPMRSPSGTSGGAVLKQLPALPATGPQAPARELPDLPARDAVVRMRAEIAATHGEQHGERSAAELFASYDARGAGVLDRGQIAQLLRENMGSALGSIRLSLQKKSY